MLKLLTSELEKVHNYHWILDGFPRTLGQGELLDGQLRDESINIVVNLDVPDGVILERIQRELALSMRCHLTLIRTLDTRTKRACL